MIHPDVKGWDAGTGTACTRYMRNWIQSPRNNVGGEEINRPEMEKYLWLPYGYLLRIRLRLWISKSWFIWGAVVRSECLIPECVIPECTIPECATPQCQSAQVMSLECTIPKWMSPECTILKRMMPECVSTSPKCTIPEWTSPEDRSPECKSPEWTSPVQIWQLLDV